jgi:hypothetical protein
MVILIINPASDLASITVGAIADEPENDRRKV